MGGICPSRVGPAGRPAVGKGRETRRPPSSSDIGLASQCTFRQTHCGTMHQSLAKRDWSIRTAPDAISHRIRTHDCLGTTQITRIPKQRWLQLAYGETGV